MREWAKEGDREEKQRKRAQKAVVGSTYSEHAILLGSELKLSRSILVGTGTETTMKTRDRHIKRLLVLCIGPKARQFTEESGQKALCW